MTPKSPPPNSGSPAKIIIFVFQIISGFIGGFIHEDPYTAATLLAVNFLLATALLWLKGKPWAWLYVIPAAFSGILVFRVFNFSHAIASVITLIAILGALIIMLPPERANFWRRLVLVVTLLSIGTVPWIVLLHESKEPTPKPETQKSLPQKGRSAEVAVLLHPFDSASAEAARQFNVELFQELKMRAAKPIDVTFQDTTYAVWVVVSHADSLKGQAERDSFDLEVQGRYRAAIDNGKTSVKSLRVDILNKELRAVYGNSQPIDDLYQFLVSRVDTIAITDKVSDVVEYIWTIAGSYTMLKIALAEPEFRRRLVFYEINKRLEGSARKVGDESSAEFYRGNSYYNAAAESRDPSVATFRLASAAYQNSAALWNSVESPLKRDLNKVYFNWGKSRTMVYRGTGARADADSARQVYRAYTQQYRETRNLGWEEAPKARVALEAQTKFLKDLTVEQYRLKRYTPEDFHQLCDEFIEGAKKLQETAMRDPSMDPKSGERTVTQIFDEIAAVSRYRDSY